jgi:hypothetical protein
MERKLYAVFMYDQAEPDAAAAKDYLCSRLYSSALCFTTHDPNSKLLVLSTFESDQDFLDFAHAAKEEYPALHWIVRDVMPDMQALIEGFFPE